MEKRSRAGIGLLAGGALFLFLYGAMSHAAAPVTRTALCLLMVLPLLLGGCLLLWARELRGWKLAAFLMLALLATAVLGRTFQRENLGELLLDEENEAIRSVTLTGREGFARYDWEPSEAAPQLVDKVIQGGSAAALQEGLGNITARSYWFGPAAEDPVLSDVAIHTTERDTLFLHAWDGGWVIRLEDASFPGVWTISEPVSRYIPREVLEFLEISE